MHASLFAVLATLSLGSVIGAALLFQKKSAAPDAGLSNLFTATGKHGRDLAVSAVSADRYILVEVASAFSAVVIAVAALGLFGFSILTLGVATVSLASGIWLPKVWLQARVSRERRTMAAAVGTLEELSAVAVAGGSEISFALRTSAGLGDGRSWRRLRAAAHASLYSNSTFSNELHKLADVYGSSELRNLASLLSTTENGGVSQNSLEELSTSQARSQERARMDRAESNLAMMVVPVGLLFSSFALFVGLLVSYVLSEVQI